MSTVPFMSNSHISITQLTTYFSDLAARCQPLQARCALCETSQGTLSRCAGCRLVKYCSRGHQVQHRDKHKSACKKTIKLRDKLQKEEHAVRNATPDFMTPPNAFETHVGRFWGLLHTRPYMRARWAVADHAVQMATLDGVTEGLGHLRDMLRLCRGDNMGVRDCVPALMLRLNQDQQAYDFIKWYETEPDEHYDWGDMSLPFLNTRDADVLEEPTHLLGKYAPINFQVAVLLLKFKMLVDIRQILITRKVTKGRLPTELSKLIAEDALQSPLSSCFLNKSHLELIRTEKRIVSHCMKLGAAIVQENQHFVALLLEPDEEVLSHRPEMYSRGSYEEATLALQNAYAAWQGTVGALDLLKDARACAAKDSEDEVQDYLDDDVHGRTAQEMLSDLSINRVWGYLKDAIANGSYLGPPADRPSERWTREAKKAWDDAIAEEEEDWGSVTDSEDESD
ncbi:hypothetical protein ACN47E_004956 [Coniothyrium glycines]